MPSLTAVYRAWRDTNRSDQARAAWIAEGDGGNRYEDVDIVSLVRLDVINRCDPAAYGIVLNHAIGLHLIDYLKHSFHATVHFAISASISARSFVTLSVSTREPFSVTSTSSSMRTPMPRYFAGISLLKPSGMRLVSGET